MAVWKPLNICWTYINEGIKKLATVRCGVENGADVGCVFYCCQVGEVVSTYPLGFGPDQLSADKKVLSSLSGNAHKGSYKKAQSVNDF